MLHHSPSSHTRSSLPSLPHYYYHLFPLPKRLHLCPIHSTSPSPNLSLSSITIQKSDETLVSLLKKRRTDEAYTFYSRLSHLPDKVCLSRLLAQLSHRAISSPPSLSRARSILRRLDAAGELSRLDCNSLGLLAVASAQAGQPALCISVVRFMLRSGFLPHVKAWTAAMSALIDGDSSSDALRLYRSIIRRLPKITGSPNSAIDKEVSEALPDTGAFNVALNACANLGDIKTFSQIFLHEMKDFKTEPDVLTYNVLVKMCARAGRKDLVLSTFELIICKGLTPCISSLSSLVASYVGFGDINMAEKLIQAMRENRTDICQLLRDEQNSNNTNAKRETLVNEESTKLLEEMVPVLRFDEPAPVLPKLYRPDTRIYTILMKGYMKAGRLDDVVCTISAMKLELDPTSRPDHVTYTTVISALANVGATQRARAVLDEMLQSNIPATRVTYNILLKGYCDQLQLDKAKGLMNEMTRVGIEPDVVSYNILINGCILVDDSAGALAYFNEMRDRGIAPSKISYTTLMKAFVFSGQPKLAHKVFDEMENDPRVRVDTAAWNMVVDGYCKLGLITEAKKLIERMKESGFLPNVSTYGSLANGIALARKPGEALLLWNEVKERCNGPTRFIPDMELLDTLADICVRAAFFKKALEIVACMEENGIPPNRTKYKKIYIEMHSRMFTSKHASQARQDRRKERKRAAEAFKFWLGLPNSYYGDDEWSLEPFIEDGESLNH